MRAAAAPFWLKQNRYKKIIVGHCANHGETSDQYCAEQNATRILVKRRNN